MSDIDQVLERLLTDEGFKRQLSTDPRTALAAYQLTSDDLILLANQVTDEATGQTAVEQRTSKSAFFSLFSQVGEVAHGGPALHGGGGGTGGEHGIIIYDHPAPDAPAGLGGPDTLPEALGGPDTIPGEPF